MLSRRSRQRVRAALRAYAQRLQSRRRVVKVVSHPLLTGPGRLLAGPMPHRPLEPSLRRIRDEGGTVVLCLLQDTDLPHEILDDLLGAYRGAGLEVLRFPVSDWGVPDDPDAFAALVSDLLARLQRGEGVFVHCHAGQGRTGIVLACLLRAAGFTGDPVSEIRTIYHPRAVENPEQRLFVLKFVPRPSPATDGPPA
jgi:protein-tyrosine phosphatase